MTDTLRDGICNIGAMPLQYEIIPRPVMVAVLRIHSRWGTVCMYILMPYPEVLVL